MAKILHAVYSEIAKTKQFAETLILDYKNKNKTVRQQKRIFSYKWKCKKLPIDVFRKILIEKKVIDKISPKDFEMIFRGQAIDDITIPIKWLSSNASELLYFIIRLYENDIIEKRNRLDYTALITCFTKSDGTKFSEKFKSLKTDIKYKLDSDKQELIDKIISDFLK